MSHILKQEGKIQIVQEIIHEFKTNNINYENIEFALENLIPKTNNEITYNIKNNKITTIAFYPSTKSIDINIENTKKILEKNINELKRRKTNTRTFKAYFITYMLAHEIEHAYQYLIAKNLIEKDEELLKRTYKEIFKILDYNNNNINTLKKSREKLSALIYIINQNSMILERNANLESLDLVVKCAQEFNNEEMYDIFNNMLKITLTLGYKKNNCGCIKETFKKLLCQDIYNKIYIPNNLDENSRAWYGLEIKEKTREKILNYKL